jgi:hypothetical protein
MHVPIPAAWLPTEPFVPQSFFNYESTKLIRSQEEELLQVTGWGRLVTQVFLYHTMSFWEAKRISVTDLLLAAWQTERYACRPMRQLSMQVTCT